MTLIQIWAVGVVLCVLLCTRVAADVYEETQSLWTPAAWFILCTTWPIWFGLFVLVVIIGSLVDAKAGDTSG